MGEIYKPFRSMTYTPSSIKIGLGIQILKGYSQTQRQHAGCISLLSLFQNKEILLKTVSFVRTPEIINHIFKSPPAFKHMNTLNIC
jgi:hypothetical protein